MLTKQIYLWGEARRNFDSRVNLPNFVVLCNSILKPLSATDIACYPYVGLAPEGKVALEPYPNVRAWIEQIKQLSGYEGMPGLE